MTKAAKEPSRLTKALLETAGDMRRGGLLDMATLGNITMRHLGAQLTPIPPRAGA